MGREEVEGREREGWGRERDSGEGVERERERDSGGEEEGWQLQTECSLKEVGGWKGQNSLNRNKCTLICDAEFNCSKKAAP